jgi:hypothetical protein
VVARVAGKLLESRHVLGEAGPAESDPRLEELRSDAVVEAHAAGDLDHVGTGLLAHVRDLVDERDLRRQEGVGGQLDHLGRLDVRADDRGVERAVERLDRVAGPVAVVADHDAVRLEEVPHGGALLEELGAGDVAEALALVGEPALDALPRPHRDGRLHHERVTVGRRHRVDDRLDGREVGVAGVGRRRADRDEQQPGVLQRRRQVGREVQPRPVLADQVRESRLPDRDPPLLEPADLLGVDVDAVDVGAQGGEPRRGDQADVAGADDSDRLSIAGGDAHEGG